MRAHSSPRLLWEAEPILVVVTELRATSLLKDLERLRARLVRKLGEFQDHARNHGVDPLHVSYATDVLSALIDHVVTSMPWGADAGWKPLGGSKAAARRPAERILEVARACEAHADLRELVCVAFGLGFDKRSRGADETQIEQALARLTQLQAENGPGAGLRLSPHSPRSIARRRAWTSWLPLWVASAVIAALLAVLFYGLNLSLGAKSDQLYARMAALRAPETPAQSPLPADTPRLASSLADQVAAGELFVRDELDRSLIVVPELRLFEPDSATLRPQSARLLQPIAAALNRTPGRIRVIGHTSGMLERSARYPSDWEFSVERARAVQAALSGLGIDTSRIVSDGRADIEPLAAADPARAISGDGRITILLLAGR